MDAERCHELGCPSGPMHHSAQPWIRVVVPPIEKQWFPPASHNVPENKNTADLGTRGIFQGFIGRYSSMDC
jgi:hypothetical protein